MSGKKKKKSQLKRQRPDAGRLLTDARYQQEDIPLARKCADAEIREQTCDGQLFCSLICFSFHVKKVRV